MATDAATDQRRQVQHWPWSWDTTIWRWKPRYEEDQRGDTTQASPHPWTVTRGSQFKERPALHAHLKC